MDQPAPKRIKLYIEGLPNEKHSVETVRMVNPGNRSNGIDYSVPT